MTERSLKAAQEQAQQQEKRRQKRMLSTAIVALVLAGGFTGGTFVLERVRANQRPIHDDTTIPDMRPEKQAARFARAQELRGQWEKWAREHASDLKAMHGGDRAAYNRVLSALPDEAALDRYGLGGPVVSNNAVPFAFGFDLRVPLSPNPNSSPEQQARSQANQAELKRLFDQGHENSFVKFHDVMVFESSNLGSKTARVWASGRVTEQAVVGNPDRTSGSPAFITTEREVTPAYEFIS